MAIHLTLTSTTPVKTTTQPRALYYFFTCYSHSVWHHLLQFLYNLPYIDTAELQLQNPRKWFPVLEIHIAYWLKNWKMFICSLKYYSLTEKASHRNLLQAPLSDDLPQTIPVRFSEWFALGQADMKFFFGGKHSRQSPETYINKLRVLEESLLLNR